LHKSPFVFETEKQVESLYPRRDPRRIGDMQLRDLASATQKFLYLATLEMPWTRLSVKRLEFQIH
jgi:hypothetical protein